ncbi:MAG: hypothetical protein M0P71_01350 [Melioribacteraceae bacterium]|nr:hypothetical protein [Melioribacteraceae bacterium]
MLDTSFDKNFKYPDNTKLSFDTYPRDLMRGMQDSYHYSSEVELYGAKYVEIDADEGYKGWTNWTHKFQPDVRFGVISDKNAYCQQFPEVRSPWKFTEYIFKGIYSGTTVIEPPLYSPKTLTVINGIVNPENNDPLFEYNRKSGRLRRAVVNGQIRDTESEELYEPLYLYQTKYDSKTIQSIIDKKEANPGRIYKQEDLEIGVTVNGVKYEKWTAPDAHVLYKNTFIKKGIYGFRKILTYPKTNAGVRYYRKDVAVKSVDRGQHGNVPSNFINMSAPSEWLDSSNLYTNVVTPRVTATFGSPMYAVDDGIISYEATTVGGDTRSYIERVESWNYLNILPSGVYVEPAEISDKIQQPRPNQIGKVSSVGGGLPNTIRCIRNSDINDGEIVHKGCSFFKRDFGITTNIACKCFVDEKPEGVFNVNLCQMYNVSYDGNGIETKSPKEFYKEAGGICPYYTPTGKREIITFETTAATQEQYAKAFSGVDRMSGYFVNGDAAMAMSNTPFATPAIMGGLLLSQKNAMDSLPTNPVQMGEGTVRYKVEYEFTKMLAEGREIIRDKFPSKSDYETILEGTGKMAFDTKGTGYGGVDTDIYSGTNLLSRHRFNCSVMPCYNSEKCNRAYGTVKMLNQWENGIYAGVDGQDYCRYYNQGCPHTEVPRRALEYDKKYRHAMSLIIPIFRYYGIGGFSGIREHEIGSGVYAAVGMCEELDSLDFINTFPTVNDKLYFYYTISSSDTENHTKSILFVHLKQYDYNNNLLLMSLSSNSKPAENYPDNVPWLVKLYDDYVSPSKFETYINNVRPFMGGRMPEYKDYSKMGSEVMCPMLTGGTGIFGREGNSGTDSKDDYSDNTKVFRGYRIDKTGEFIVDGRTLGGVVPSTTQARAYGVPTINNEATPIDGTMGTSMINANNSSGATVTNAWIYSSDTRDILNSEEMINMTNSDGKSAPPKTPPDGVLPKERTYYLCPKCNISTDQFHIYNGLTNDKLNYWGEPVVPQIITDLEYVYFEGKCPRCDNVLDGPYQWSNFPQVESSGVVNIWGFPGQEVRLDGYYWKNHTEISRSFISEIFTKLGPQKTDGGGYLLKRESSANYNTEGSVCLPHKQKGMNTKQGILKDGKLDESTILQYARNDKYVTEPISLHQENDNRLTSGKYNDGQISPYNDKIDGLDFFSANHLKTLRNFIQPMLGYSLSEPPEGSDFFNTKQVGNKYRFDNLIPKKFPGKRKGLNPIVLASTETDGEGNYVQFWDGSISPGKVIIYWYPPSKVWWYRYGYIGGISRAEGTNSLHFDNSFSENRAGGTDGYVGDVYSNSYVFPHGWIPLDKEVVRVIASVTPVSLPTAPRVGTVWSGRVYNYHYHPLLVGHEGENQMTGEHHFNDNDINEKIDYTVGTENTEKYNFSSESYVSYIYNKKYSFYENPPISQFTDDSYGFNFSQDLLEWNGFGSDIIQNKTEAEAWKDKTYEEFRDTINRYTINGKVVIGDKSSHGLEVDFTIVPPSFANGYYNNKTQYIPDYFDYTGMNDTLIYDKNGPMFEPKYYDTSWSESGQVIVQNYEIKTSASISSSITTGGNGSTGSSEPLGNSSSKFGKPLNFDMTDYFKLIYNKRNSRAYKLSTGLSFSQIGNYIISEKIKAYEDSTSEYAPNQLNNDRYGNAVKGFWLNNWNMYPQKNENGEFPTIISGEEYPKNKNGILDDYSGCYISPDSVVNGVSNSNFNNFNPLVLCMAKESVNSISQKSGYTPSTSGSWSSSEVWEPSLNSEKYWLYYSNTNDSSYISFKLSGFPTEKERRPYRYEKGKWNVANAICPNAGNCRIANRGLTVSEAIGWCESPSAYGGFKVIRPSLDSIHCAECGTDLTKSPEKTGAFYTGGDGILTITYGELPDKNCFITSINVEQKENNYCDFSIMYKNEESSFWKTLINIYWDSISSKWLVPKYLNGELLYSEYSSIPELNGKWIDGGVINANKNIADNYNFIVPRANKIKYQCNPSVPKNIIMLTPVLGNTFLENMIDSNKFKIKIDCSSLRSDELGESYFELSNDFSLETGKVRYKIKSNDESSITLYELFQTSDTRSKFRIYRTAYVSTCKKLEVYGYETTPDILTITKDCNSLIVQIPIAMQTSDLSSFPISIPENPSKIISLGAGSSGNIKFLMQDNDTNDNLYWKVRMNGTEYEIYGGNFFFNNSTHSLMMPTYCIDQTGKEIKINNIKQSSIPTFLEIKYVLNNGSDVEVKATSIGNGPSYLLEKDSIRFIYGNENKPDGYSSDIMKQIQDSGGSTDNITILPSIGNSIVFQHNVNNSGKACRKDMKWIVTNPNRCDADFQDLQFVGNELHGNKERNFDEILNGGTGSEKTNGFVNSKHIIGGKVETSVVLSGLPNTIISGDLYVYAKAITEEVTTYRTPLGMETKKTYERTGGIDKTGFMIGVKDLLDGSSSKKGRRGICFTKPQVIVYLRERDSTEEI